MEVGLRDVVEILAAVFVLGGIWRDIKATQRDVRKLKEAYASDRSTMIQLAAEHNQNHGSSIRIPATNGSDI